jgi:hypothetical protein
MQWKHHHYSHSNSHSNPNQRILFHDKILEESIVLVHVQPNLRRRRRRHPSSSSSSSSSSSKQQQRQQQQHLATIWNGVAHDLGMTTTALQSHWTILMYLNRQQRVVGWVAVEPIQQAYQLEQLKDTIDTDAARQRQTGENDATTTNNTNTNTNQIRRKAVLGVAVVWTHASMRQQGIATRLCDAARSHAVFGMVVSKSQIAFSSPTQAGWAFATKYVLYHHHHHDTGTGTGTTGTASPPPPLVYDYQEQRKMVTANNNARAHTK